MSKLHATIYPCNWGIIIPCESGVVWTLQTCGCACFHVQIEGIFIPLSKPIIHHIFFSENLLDKLQSANYVYGPKWIGTDENGKYLFEDRDEEHVIDAIWEKIKLEMSIGFEKIDAPEGQPQNQEGIQWIHITSAQSRWDEDCFVQLLGKDVALIYPNSD